MIRWVLLLLMLPGAALACACCAEKGERFERQIDFDYAVINQLATLEPVQPARLFLTACGMECVVGVVDPQEAYDVVIAVGEAGVEFDFSDTEGRYRGTIGMNWPAPFTLTGVDTDPTGEGHDPALYLELQMRGKSYGTGDFATIQLAETELVFSGHGNMCFDPGLLDNWVLTVRDEGVDLRLFGAVEPE